MTTFQVGDIVRLKSEWVTAELAGYIVKVDEKAVGHYKNGSLQSLPYTIRWFDGAEDSDAGERHLEKIEQESI